MLKGVLLLWLKNWEEALSLPRCQLAGLEVKDPQKVLTGISGHGESRFVGLHSLWWNVKH